MKKNIIIDLGEPNSISSEIFLKSINYIRKTKLNFIIIGNYSLLKKEIVNSLIDRKIKDIETNYFKIEVSEKEIEINLYNYLERIKVNNEIINSFYNQN